MITLPISPPVLGIARAQVRHRWRQLVVIGLVAGLVGGVSIAAFAGARRTSTAYDRLVDGTGFPDLFVQLIEPRDGAVEAVAALPQVARAVPSVFAVGVLVDAPVQVLVPLQAPAGPVDDPRVVEGRELDPSVSDEVTVSEEFADALGLSVGDTVVHRALTDAEFADLLRDDFDGSASGIETAVTVVGITRSPTDSVLEEFPTMTASPAAYDRLREASGGAAGIWVDLGPGTDADSFTDAVVATIGGGDEARINGVTVTDFAAERSSVDDGARLLSIGLAVVGLAVAVGGAVLLAQLVGRLAGDTQRELRVLRDLGLPARGRLAAAVLASWLSSLVCLPVALAVAVVGSAATPLGVARAVEPDPGIEVNVVVVACGILVLLLGLLGVWIAATVGVALGSRRRSRPARPINSGAHPVLGVAATFALRSGGRRPGRALGFGGVGVAVAGLVASLLFGASLDRMVEDSGRWGWPGDLSIEVPGPARDAVYEALDRAPEIAAYAEVRGADLVVGGEATAGYSVESRRGSIAPTILDGRAPGSGEIALGPALLDRLDVTIGSRVETSIGDRVVVGEAITFGFADSGSHTDSALFGGRLDDADFTTALVQVSDGVDPGDVPAAVLADAEYGTPVMPAEVANLSELRVLPRLLLAVFAAIGTVAIVHIARSCGDGNRRDLAVLRALGMSRLTGARTVLLAAALAVAVACAVGLPLGVVAGVRLWSLVAGGTDLATDPAVPGGGLLLVPAVVALVASSGWIAGRLAVRPTPAQALRSE